MSDWRFGNDWNIQCRLSNQGNGINGGAEGATAGCLPQSLFDADVGERVWATNSTIFVASGPCARFLLLLNSCFTYHLFIGVNAMCCYQISEIRSRKCIMLPASHHQPPFFFCKFSHNSWSSSLSLCVSAIAFFVLRFVCVNVGSLQPLKRFVLFIRQVFLSCLSSMTTLAHFHLLLDVAKFQGAINVKRVGFILF